MTNALHLHFDEWPFTDSSGQNKPVTNNDGVTITPVPSTGELGEDSGTVVWSGCVDGTTPPGGWSRRFETNPSYHDLISCRDDNQGNVGDNPFGNKVIEKISSTSVTNLDIGLSKDALDNTGQNHQILALWKNTDVAGIVDGYQRQCSTFFRGSGVVPGSNTYYSMGLRFFDQWHVTKTVNNVNTFINVGAIGGGFDASSGLMFWTRAWIFGTNLKFKIWEYGTPEPGAWHVEITGESSISSGTWTGTVANQRNARAMCYYFEGQVVEDAIPVEIPVPESLDTSTSTTSAGVFDGTTSLSVAKSNSLTPANNEDWEIDFLVEHATILGTQTYYAQYEDIDNRCKLELLTGPAWGLHFLYRYNGTDLISLSGAGGEITDTDLHHIALSKEGDTFRLFLDGTKVAETTYTFSSSELIDSDIYISQDGNSANYFTGNMLKYRISNTTRFTTDFIPDMSGSYETDEFTQLLINFNGIWVEQIGTGPPDYVFGLNSHWWGDEEMDWDGSKWIWATGQGLTPLPAFRTDYRPTHIRVTYSDVGLITLRLVDDIAFNNIVNEVSYVSGTPAQINWGVNNMAYLAFDGATSAIEITSIEFLEIDDTAEAGLSVWNPTQVTRGNVDTGVRIYKFGNQCGFFPGSQDGFDPYAIQLADHPNWNIEDREFTLDTHVHPLSLFNYAGIFHQNTRVYWYIDSTGKLNWYIEDGVPLLTMQSSGAVPTDEWSHIALTRSLELTGATPGGPIYMLPDEDVGSGTLIPFGAGSGRWDRLNSGIDSGTPDDTNGMWGQDDQYRLGFTNPSFVGTTTGIIVRYRSKSDGTDGVNVTLYSDGASSDGQSGLEFPGGSYSNFEYEFSVAKTAAELTNLEVLVKSWSGAWDDYFSEVEVELVGVSNPGTPDSLGQVWRMYINGVRQAQTTENVTIPNLTGPLWIGRGTSDSDLFHGYMDELRLLLGKPVWTDNKFWPYDYPYELDSTSVFNVQELLRRRIHSIKGR